jgi:hypothetical protein
MSAIVEGSRWSRPSRIDPETSTFPPTNAAVAIIEFAGAEALI